MAQFRSTTVSSGARSLLVTSAAAAVLAGAILLALLRVTSLGSLGDLRLGAAASVMSDFKSTIYYPAKAYADGANPYHAERYLARYPAPEPLRLYPPATLLVFRPFASLPLEVAMGVQAILTVLLTGVLAYVSLRLARAPTSAAAVLLLWGLILISRPGQWNLLQGQMTLLVVLGVYAAFAAGTLWPSLAGLGLALSLLKPNFGIPVAGLMLARGQYTAVAIGTGLAAMLNLVAVATLADLTGGWHEFGLMFFGTGDQLRFSARLGTELSVFRIDGPSLLSRWLGLHLGVAGGLLVGAVFLGVVIYLFRHRRKTLTAGGPPNGIVAGLLCSAVLISMYHVGYDLLLLTWPLVALVKDIRARPATPLRQWVQLGLLLLLAFNYVTTFSVLEALRAEGALFLIVSSLNGAALAALFSLYLWDGMTPQREESRTAVRRRASAPPPVHSA